MRSNNIKDFRQIEFGSSDAQTEASDSPDLLINGFLDPTGMVDHALNRREFLFLGSKGSGKSALSEHIRLKSEYDQSISVNTILLNEFPYKLFSKVVKGDAEYDSKFQIAWRFILLLYIFQSFDRECEFTNKEIGNWYKTSCFLKDKGLFPISNISQLVNKTSKRTFGLNLEIISYSVEQGSEAYADTNAFSEFLKNLISYVETSKKHYLIIDGLDETLTERNEQHKTIVALINQAKEINNWCRALKIPFKIIVLCRTDIFERLSDPNKNKIKQDFSFDIRWFDESETEDDKRSNLIHLANLRCKLTYGSIDDLFDVFFPKTYENKPVRKALLDYTRHTPRDFLQLLKKIQMSCRGNKVTVDDITSGIKKYSMDYFKNEIRDELAGYTNPKDIDLIFQMLSEFRQRDFKYSEIEKLRGNNPAYKDIDLRDILSTLFDCSAIGNRIGDDNFLYLKYRNPSKTFSHEHVIMIHRGLWKALS